MQKDKSFYDYLKKKYPKLIDPQSLIIWLFTELLLYAEENSNYKLKYIGNFFLKDNQLKFKMHKKFEKKGVKIDEIFSIKSPIVIHQMNMDSVNSVLANIENVREEESIHFDSDMDLNDLF